jgi:hypothetical protein
MSPQAFAAFRPPPPLRGLPFLPAAPLVAHRLRSTLRRRLRPAFSAAVGTLWVLCEYPVALRGSKR